MRLENLLLLALVAGGCEESKPAENPAPAVDSSVAQPDAGSSPDGQVESPPPGLPLARANLKFKRGLRLKQDYAQTLGLDPAEVCEEMGQYDCVTRVHGVTLGGVDAYARGLFKPNAETGVTSPLAVDRMALAACSKAVDRHAELLFGPLDALGDEGFEGEALAEALDHFYKRALHRPVEPTEVEHLRQLYRDVAEESEDAARDFGVLACFAVLTSLEAVFY